MLLEEGAVFTRPYGDLAPIVYERAAGYAHQLKRLKKVFDPNNIMNPSQLVFLRRVTWLRNNPSVYYRPKADFKFDITRYPEFRL